MSKIRRLKGAQGDLSIGESVTLKTKSHVWKAVVKDTDPQVPSRKCTGRIGQQSIQSIQKQVEQSDRELVGQQKEENTDSTENVCIASFNAAEENEIHEYLEDANTEDMDQEDANTEDMDQEDPNTEDLDQEDANPKSLNQGNVILPNLFSDDFLYDFP